MRVSYCRRGRYNHTRYSRFFHNWDAASRLRFSFGGLLGFYHLRDSRWIRNRGWWESMGVLQSDNVSSKSNRWIGVCIRLEKTLLIEGNILNQIFSTFNTLRQKDIACRCNGNYMRMFVEGFERDWVMYFISSLFSWVVQRYQIGRRQRFLRYRIRIVVLPIKTFQWNQKGNAAGLLEPWNNIN